MKISVCIFTYLRPQVLEEQLRAIREQTIPIDEIILGHLENSKTPSFDFKDYKLIRFHFDPGLHSKFIVASAIQPNTDFIIMIDDDIIPGKKWIENCLTSYKEKEGAYGILGFNLALNSPSGCIHSAGKEQLNSKIAQVDFIGQGWFLHFKYLQYMWAEPMPFYNRSGGDDIWFGYQLYKHGIKSYIPPYPSNDQEMWGNKKMRAVEESLFLRGKFHNECRKRFVEIGTKKGWKSIK